MRGSLLGQVHSKMQRPGNFFILERLRVNFRARTSTCSEKEGKGHFFSSEGWTRLHTDACFLISKKGEATAGHVSVQLVLAFCAVKSTFCVTLVWG